MRAYLHPCATARIRVLSSVSLTLFACTIFVVSPGVIAQADGTENETYCGLAVGTGWEKGAFRGQTLNNALNGIRNVNANTAQFSFYIRQRGVNSTNDYYYYSDVDELRHSIRVARRRGFKVFVKPVVDVEDEDGDYVWRGLIPGKGSWFVKTYKPFIKKMAIIAQQEKVDIFAVGSELRDTLHRVGYWKSVIALVRSIYKGKLTYVANHDAYREVKFFKHLDIIGLSAYFRLEFNPKAKVPTYNDTLGRLNYRATRLQRWRKEKKLTDKMVLIAEVGYQSKAWLVNYYVPWAWDFPAKRSDSSQYKLYRAFAASFLTRPWCIGVVFWHWNMYGPDEKGYSPQGKPALEIVREEFDRIC